MLTIYSEDHKFHNNLSELYGGQIVPPFEKIARMDYIINRINHVKLGAIEAPRDFGMEPVLKIHDNGYIEFLSTAYSEWKKAGFKGEVIANAWPSKSMHQDRRPRHIDGLVAYYALASETAIGENTYKAVVQSKNVALSATSHLINGAKSCFALCRPPGHHATSDKYGGYCFINNAAVAAQYLRDYGNAKRVAILDVDFHHGNGTQDIFYKRNDVYYLSLHGHPEYEYPYFLGFADELGAGDGLGYNKNYPMLPGTNYDEWGKNLHDSLDIIAKYDPQYLIISLGVDAFEKDPISSFKLTSTNFAQMGEAIGKLKIPTLFVMEGGYAVEEVGINTVNVLEGFSKHFG